jgi:hypothetical protein
MGPRIGTAGPINMEDIGAEGYASDCVSNLLVYQNSHILYFEALKSGSQGPHNIGIKFKRIHSKESTAMKWPALLLLGQPSAQLIGYPT